MRGKKKKKANNRKKINGKRIKAIRSDSESCKVDKEHGTDTFRIMDLSSKYVLLFLFDFPKGPVFGAHLFLLKLCIVLQPHP